MEVKSNRERYTDRLKAKYPDKEFADDEALFAQINDEYDGLDKELSGYKEREKALSDLFASNPRSAAFLTDWRKGEDPIIGMIRKFGDDFKAALEDPEKQEALAAANKEYAERIAKEKEFEEQYQLFVTTQKELGAKKLDQKINRQMQENFSYYGKKIEKVNPQMQDTSKSNGETKP